MNERKAYLNNFSNKIKVEENNTINKLISSAQDVGAAVQLEVYKNAGSISQNVQKDLDGQIAILKQYKNKPKIADTLNALENIKIESKAVADIKNMNVSDILKYKAPIITGSNAEAASDLKTMISVDNAKKKFLESIVKDPAGTYKSNNPTIQEGTPEFYQGQVDLGYPNPKYISNATAKQETYLLTKAPNKGQALDDFIAKYTPRQYEGEDIDFKSDNASIILKQMALDKPSLAPFALAIDVVDPDIRESMLPQNKEEELKALTAKHGFSTVGELRKEYIEKVDSEFEELKKGFDGSGMSDALYNTVVDAAILNAARKKASGFLDTERAVKSATDEILKEFTVIKTENSNHPLVFMKKNLNSNIKINDVSKFVNGFLKRDDKIPNMELLDITPTGNRSKQTPENFINAFYERKPFFKTSPTGDSLEIYYLNDNSYPQPLKDSKGKDIQIPISDITSYNSKFGPYISGNTQNEYKEKVYKDKLKTISKKAKAIWHNK